MGEKLKELAAYYKPYKGLFFSDMFFAILGAVTLILPLIVRYITNEVVDFPAEDVLHTITWIGVLMFGLVILEFGCNYFIGYYGHFDGCKDGSGYAEGHFWTLPEINLRASPALEAEYIELTHI